MTIRPRSIRARLVATYAVVALILAAAGLLLFAALLNRGILGSVDASLRARSAPVVAAVHTRPPAPQPTGGATPLPAGPASADVADVPNRSSSTTPGGAAPGIDAFTAVYGPGGRVVALQPGELRSSPLSAAQVRGARSHLEHLRIRLGDEEVRVLTTPVRSAQGTWVVAAGLSLAPFTSASNEAIHEIEVAGPALILLATLGAWLLSGAALRPVERMRADADALGERDPASRLSVPSTADELARLAVTFNALLDRLHRSLARQRDLIADAGHELRTPLSVLRIELELADDARSSRQDLADAVRHARAEVERLSRLAEDLLFLARADSASPLVQLEETDLSVVIADSVRAHRSQATALGAELIMDAPGPRVTLADPAGLRRSLDNLIANALAASPAGGTVKVECRQTATETTVVVSDDGPGFPGDFLAHAFERFARPDLARSSDAGGAGLGLAIVAQIVDAHHGTVTAANRRAGGATVSITLPAVGGFERIHCA